jgi:hypothetical protein
MASLSGLSGPQQPPPPPLVALAPGAHSISSGSGTDSFSTAEQQLQAAGGTSSSSEGGASSCSVRGSLSGGGSVVELSTSKSEAALAHGAGILSQPHALLGSDAEPLPEAWSTSGQADDGLL